MPSKKKFLDAYLQGIYLLKLIMAIVLDLLWAIVKPFMKVADFGNPCTDLKLKDSCNVRFLSLPPVLGTGV